MRLNGYYDFQWNLDGVENSKLKDVQILLDTDYHWGSGMTVSQMDTFNKEISTLLRKNSWDVETREFDSKYIVREKNGIKSELFLHPMEVSGYATEKEAKELLDIFSNAKCVYSAKLTQLGDLLKLDNKGYEELFDKNKDGIYRFFEQAEKRHVSKYEMGFEFVRNFGLKIDGDRHVGLSSIQTDVKKIKSMYEEYEREKNISSKQEDEIEM